MATDTMGKIKDKSGLTRLRAKAAILDELMELIEEKYLSYLMKSTEKEKNIPLPKAKKMFN